MGTCVSKTIEEQRNKEIEDEIKEEKETKVCKLLLLGKIRLKLCRMLSFSPKDILYSTAISEGIIFS